MRIRTVKPEFWQHEGMASLPPLTRLLAIAILNWSDDEGYFQASPKLIRGSLLPFEDDSTIIPRMLDDLSKVGWIELGKDSQGRDVGRVLNFGKHQKVDRPQKTKIQGFTRIDDNSSSDPRVIVNNSPQEWNGSGNGMDLPPTPPEGGGKGCDLIDMTEKIVDAYLRRDDPSGCRSIVMECLSSKTDPITPEDMLERVQLCSEYIRRWPGGGANQKVPKARNFFARGEWRSPEGYQSPPSGHSSSRGYQKQAGLFDATVPDHERSTV